MCSKLETTSIIIIIRIQPQQRAATLQLLAMAAPASSAL
eukprot:CAMPEP_0197645944 /NCGR_PEP_ID=MMETSP1338-20131121/21199_1 /TAXON_ID=43686 ORGANISM="Pelagodinium beii, Strain RCC1491" /NCGR_SAMPLE_ID=MMETSP1338 /ASSEMBLY_ACC=CAM_ASM_000754 /LENGTH=38 /DNA_ID= /DNA_START= /DNA_END= /DNA_ORIENTATION=